MLSTRYKGDLLVLISTACWGTSYLFLKIALRDLLPFNTMALRFSVAFLLTAVIFQQNLRRMTSRALWHGLRLGISLFFGNAMFTFGIGLTTISNAGFITGTVVVFVAVFHSLATWTFPGRTLIVGLVIAVVGVGVLTLTSGFSVHAGDALCLAGTALFALHVFLAEQAGRESDPVAACVLQFGFVALFAWLSTLLFESPVVLRPHGDALYAVCCMGVLGSAIGFVCQLVGQRYTSPTRVGFIYLMEPIFALLFAWLFANESLSLRTGVGGGLIMIGVCISLWNNKE